MINRQLVHFDTAGNRVIINPGEMTNTGGDNWDITPSGYIPTTSATSADVPNTVALRDADGGFSVGNLQVDTTPPVVQTDGVGKLVWNDTDGTVQFLLKGGNVVLRLGQEEFIRVKNDEGSPLVVGDVVYLSGANGTHALVKKASATTSLLSDYTIGMVVEAMANNAQGWVAISGYAKNLNTNHLIEGAPVWLSTVSGQTTSTKPTAPNHSVFIGLCVRKNTNVGSILLAIRVGYELGDLDDVFISGVANGDLLMYNGANTRWQNLPTASQPWVLKAGDTMTGPLNISLPGDANTFRQVSANGHVLIGTATDVTAFGGAKLQVKESGSSAGQWRGRIVAGGANFVFLLGEYNTQAWLGAHNAALSAWADVYINAGGGRVAIGGNGTVPTNTLEVNGTLKTTGACSLGGSVTMSADFSATSGRTRGTATGLNWSGRIVAGGPSNAFLLGQYNNQAWLGAHNDALTAWADLYINPQNATTTKVYIGCAGGALGQTLLTVDNQAAKVTIGYGGTALTNVVVYTPTLTPAAIVVAGFSEQTFTVNGLTTNDTVTVNGPAAAANSALIHARVSAANTLALTWTTNAPTITPTSGTYRIVATRS